MIGVRTVSLLRDLAELFRAIGELARCLQFCFQGLIQQFVRGTIASCVAATLQNSMPRWNVSGR